MHTDRVRIGALVGDGGGVGVETAPHYHEIRQPHGVLAARAGRTPSLAAAFNGPSAVHVPRAIEPTAGPPGQVRQHRVHRVQPAAGLLLILLLLQLQLPPLAARSGRVLRQLLLLLLLAMPLFGHMFHNQFGAAQPLQQHCDRWRSVRRCAVSQQHCGGPFQLAVHQGRVSFQLRAVAQQRLADESVQRGGVHVTDRPPAHGVHQSEVSADRWQQQRLLGGGGGGVAASLHGGQGVLQMQRHFQIVNVRIVLGAGGAEGVQHACTAVGDGVGDEAHVGGAGAGEQFAERRFGFDVVQEVHEGGGRYGVAALRGGGDEMLDFVCEPCVAQIGQSDGRCGGRGRVGVRGVDWVATMFGQRTVDCCVAESRAHRRWFLRNICLILMHFVITKI